MRPGHVAIEFPIEEAAALLLRLKTDKGALWVDSDPDFISGAERLERAIKIERGASGSAERPPTAKDRAEDFIGQVVRVYLKDGTSDSGTMVEGTPAVLYIEIGSGQKVRGIPYDRVSRIEAVAGAVA